jgi:hypothetical protein
LRTFAATVTRQRGAVSEADIAAFKASGFDNRAVLDVLVLAATKLISNYADHIDGTPLDSFMKGGDWQATGRTVRPPDHAVGPSVKDGRGRSRYALLQRDGPPQGADT